MKNVIHKIDLSFTKANIGYMVTYPHKMLDHKDICFEYKYQNKIFKKIL